MMKTSARDIHLPTDEISDCCYVLDRSWRITVFNSAAERYFRRARENVLGRVVWDAFPAIRGTDFETRYRRAMERRGVEHFEARSPVTSRWVAVHLYPSDEGLALFFHDVDDRKRAEESLRDSEERLATSNTLLELITDGLPVLISYIDQDERYCFANLAYERWFGSGVVVGKTVKELLGEKAYLRVREAVQLALAGEEVRFEARIDYKGVGVRDVSVIYIPDRQQHHVKGFIALVQDVSVYKRMQETLQEADKRKDEFLATLAHELRNPLAPIRNAAQLLSLKAASDPALQSIQSIIERQVAQMVHLVDDLLDVSRITLGRITLRKSLTSLQDVVASAVETARPMIEASAHTLTIDLPPSPVYVHGDFTRLSQVLQNLLNNASKYTPHGGCIHLSARAEGSSAVLCVRDNGLGIEPNMLPRIFDLFTQLEHSFERSQGGLGIGLMLVRRLVNLHGGTVEARSEGRGRGSEFIVRLPATTPDVLLLPQTSTRSSERVATQTSRRVLVVDDNRDAACSLAALLELSGHSLRVAFDGPGAIQEGAHFRPEIVLLDLGMPGMDGFAVCRNMRSAPWGKEARIIALTGWGDDEAKRHTAEAGFDNHLTKPVDPAHLASIIGRLDSSARGQVFQ